MDDLLSIRVSASLKRRLDRLAAATGRTRSFIAQEALQNYVVQESWQVAEIRKAVKQADAGEFASAAKVRKVLRKWGVNAR